MLAVIAIGICAYNGIWWPLAYVTAPIWGPLVLLLYWYSTMPAMSSLEVGVFMIFAVLWAIFIKLDTHK